MLYLFMVERCVAEQCQTVTPWRTTADTLFTPNTSTCSLAYSTGEALPALLTCRMKASPHYLRRHMGKHGHHSAMKIWTEIHHLCCFVDTLKAGNLYARNIFWIFHYWITFSSTFGNLFTGNYHNLLLGTVCHKTDYRIFI